MIYIFFKFFNIITYNFNNYRLSEEMASFLKAFHISNFKLAKYSYFFEHHLESVVITISITKASMESFFVTVIMGFIVKHLEHLSHYKPSVKFSISYITIVKNLFHDRVRFIIHDNRLAIFVNYKRNSCARFNSFRKVDTEILTSINTCVI